MKRQFVWSVAGLLTVVCVTASAFERRIETRSVGPVLLTCAKPGDWECALAAAEENGASVVTVTLRAPKAAQPPAFDLAFDFPGDDVHHVWTTDYTRHSFTIWPSLWNTGKSYGSQLAHEMPLLAALNANDEAKFTLAAGEAFDKVVSGLVVNERTCRIEGSLRFFTEPVLPVKEYSVRIRLDRRTRRWSDAVRDASDWVARTAGCEPADVPDSACDPLYSTWYAYLQDVHDKALEKEAELAASLGMKTMILDDGWQKEQSASFYSAVGDWMPVKSRFPDMKAHVDAVHRAGLKYMLWLSVPYVGDETAAWKLFEGKFLTVHGAKSPGRIGVLDPRFPEVREYLISTYERVVRDWGFDGVKLDFIDQFTRPANDPADRNPGGRDIRSVPAAVDRLMKDVLTHLKKINPDVLVEFRQHYMGPAIRQYGNMIRAADCPADMAFNRRRICDLRLTSGRTAVHSDMLVWSPHETPEGAARPILSALFGVIQYSMVLQTIPEAQREVIRHWLGFTQRHRTTLLRGRFLPHHPELGYPAVEAETDTERIVALYNVPTTVDIAADGRPVFLVNATFTKRIPVTFAGDATVACFDTCGRAAGEILLGKGAHILETPVSGYARIVCGGAGSAAVSHRSVDVSFARGKWNAADFFAAKSWRNDFTGSFDQRDDAIVNHCPDLSGKEIFENHRLNNSVYAALMYRDAFAVGSVISSKMSFDHRMAPLIVLAPGFARTAEGTAEFREHWEVVLYDEGLNVWHHFFRDGKQQWYKAASLKLTGDRRLKKDTVYDLVVKTARTGKGHKEMTVTCGEHELHYTDDSLPDVFYAGVIGCEGRNFFYDFKVKAK